METLSMATHSKSTTINFRVKHFSLPKDGGLIAKDLPKGILHSHERITTEIFDDVASGSESVAQMIVSAINEHEEDRTPRPFKLGLTTGNTPSLLYRRLAELNKEGKVSFMNTEVFSIDEYYPCGKDSPQSRNNRLHK